MLDVIEKLLILQDRDRKITRLVGELAHVEPERQMLRAKQTQTQSGLDNAKGRVKQLETDRKGLELEVQSKKEQIIKYANQQFQTRKNEEYRALAHEIDLCKETIQKIEDHELELMEQTETAQKEVVKATQEAAEARKLVEGQIALINEREANLKKELTTLESNRSELAAAVPDSPRTRYERLFKSKGENVVVGVQHGVCGGCHMKLPAQLVVSCRAQQELITCSNCGRILYYTHDMDLAVVD